MAKWTYELGVLLLIASVVRHLRRKGELIHSESTRANAKISSQIYYDNIQTYIRAYITIASASRQRHNIFDRDDQCGDDAHSGLAVLPA